MKVSDLGEEALIARLADRIGPAPTGAVWSGDDAAVLTSPGSRLVFTTDLLVEGIDFDLSWCSGNDVGWKAVAVNVSDVAAMAGRAHAAVVTLALTPSSDVSVIDDMLEGMLLAAERWDVAIVGGDVSEAKELSLSVAMIGAADPPAPVLRSGARTGDSLCVTGRLGGARAGLMALQRRGRLVAESPASVTRAATRQLRPEALAEAGRTLGEVGATAMIDVSDGLAVDLSHILSASGLGCFVDPGLVPIDPDVFEVGRWIGEEIDPLTIALTGGEDFELLLALDPGDVNDASGALAENGTELTCIGEIRDEDARIGDIELTTWKEAGWEHLRNR